MTPQTAYLILNLLPGIGPIKVRQMLTVCQSPEIIFSLPKKQLEKIPGIGPKNIETLLNWHTLCDLEAEQQAMALADITYLTPHDPDYPDSLRQLADAPLVLYVAGNSQLLNSPRALAVVGSRQTTLYGRQNTAAIVADAVQRGWVIISGLARGIDTVAHQVTCQLGGKTIAVLGNGLGQIYPVENLELARDIIRTGGAVISEFPIHTRPDRRTFPMRNRIISGLSAGTLVVEAGHNSGSLITANTANEQGKPVFAIPGRIDSPQSKGCHDLIRKGIAALVESFDDIANELSLLPGLYSKPNQTKNHQEKSLQEIDIEELELTETERLILKKLYIERETSIDFLLAEIPYPAGQILSALVTLEIKKLVKQQSGRRVSIQIDLK